MRELDRFEVTTACRAALWSGWIRHGGSLLVLLVGLSAFAASTAEGATCLVSTTGSDANSCCATAMPCLTIQEAISQAGIGDTISVAAGTYAESAAGPLVVNKMLSLAGVQAGVDARTRVGAESIIADSQGTSVSASGVLIDGFTIQGSTNAAFTGYGVWLNPGVSGTQIVNNIVQDNIIGLGISNTGPAQLVIRYNLFQNNNQPGSASGTAIYTDQFISQGAVTNVLVEQNAFAGNDNSGLDLSNTDAMQGVSDIEVRNNTFDMNGRAFDIFNTHGLNFHDNSVTNCTLPGSAALRIFDGNSGIVIVGNDLIGGVGHGIRLSDLAEVDLGPSSTVRINLNNIVPFDLDGLRVDAMSHVGTVDATCNWWGASSGPTNPGNPGGTGEAVFGDADFDPWLIGAAPEGPCGPPTPTATATATATASATVTPTGAGAPGGMCTDPSQCNGALFCVDGVCCDTPCDALTESCVLPGHVGVCSRLEGVPAASPPIKVAIVSMLLGMGWLALRALRRGRQD